MAMIAGRGRVDMRFAADNDGGLYVLTKSDGMIRKVVVARPATARGRPRVNAPDVATTSCSRLWVGAGATPARAAGSGRATPCAPPVTGTWLKER